MTSTPAPGADLGSMFHAVARDIRRSWLDQLAPWELAPHQWRALHILARADHGIRPGDLAERLRIAPRSATEVVDQLGEKGLVSRAPDPSDRRAILVAPTEAGIKLHDAVQQRRRETSDEYFSVLTPSEQESLARLLSRLTSR